MATTQIENEQLSLPLNDETEINQAPIVPTGVETAQVSQNIQTTDEEDPTRFQKLPPLKGEDPLSGGLNAINSFYDTPVMESLRAPGVGMNDFITDSINLIPGVNFRKDKKFESDVAEGVRNVSGLILPMLMTRRLALKGGASLHASKVAPPKVQALGNSPLFKWFSELGIDLGAGTLVDSIAQQNYKDDNLAAVLKETWPNFWSWIPDSWATQAGDSPDIKRNKNVMEGMRLGFISGIAEGITKIVRSGRSLERVGEWIPDPKAERNVKDAVTDGLSETKYSDNPVEDVILRNEARLEKELNLLGEVKAASGADLNKPQLGIHNLFDETESGLRLKDVDGIVGASVDAVQIQKNIDSTYGRLGNPITQAALKFGITPEGLSGRSLVTNLAEQLRQVGKYSRKLPSGKVITSQNIDQAGLHLAEVLENPRMTAGSAKQILDEFKTVSTELDTKVLNKQGLEGVKQSLTFYMNELANINVEKAKAYLTTSLAGQASDISEASRLISGAPAVRHVQDLILDRIHYLMVEKDLATYQARTKRVQLKALKKATEAGDPQLVQEVLDGSLDSNQTALEDIIASTNDFIQQLRGIANERPDFVKPLMLAYELTDGNIQSLHALNKYVQNNLGVFSKAFVDLNPEIPSIMNQALLSTIYNSMLSAFGTPLKAAVGNFGGLIGRPMATLYGVLREGDLTLARRAFHQYTGFSDTFQKGLQHLSLVYRKVSTDPSAVSYIVREDIAFQKAQNLKILNSFAEAADAQGEFGASTLLSIHEQWEALAEHPWLRFGANAMTALDGFSRAVNMNAEAKGLAFDKLFEAGEEITGDSLRKISDEIYNKSFDANGMIKNEAVEYVNSEIALNLDSELVRGFNNILKYAPMLRTFFWFPKTSMNMLDMFRKWSPLDGAHAGHKFAGDYAEFVGKPLDQYNQAEIQNLLLKKGEPIDGDWMTRFKMKRAEIRGRVAIGSMAIMSGGVMFAQGRLRGNGHWDPQRQRTRRQLNWEPKTYQGWDGKWYSYEFLGPLGDWLALVSDVGDNFDNITTAKSEQLFKKLSFVLGASLTNRSILSNMEPLNDVLAGNPAAAQRWASTLVNSMLPMAGLRNELGKLLAPGLREVNQDFFELLRNRNNWMDVTDIEKALPNKYSWVSGKKVKYPENWFARVSNIWNPWKVVDNPTAEEQFLIDIEYNQIPHFTVSSKGVELNKEQQSELYSLIGEQGYFNYELKKIMRDAERLTHPEYGTGFTNILRKVRRGEIPSSVLETEKFAQIYHRITLALNQAKRLAEASISNKEQLIEQQYRKSIIEQAHKGADIDTLLQLANPR